MKDLLEAFQVPGTPVFNPISMRFAIGTSLASRTWFGPGHLVKLRSRND